MDYDQARVVGDAAEARVIKELERLRLRYGFVVLNDLLIGKQTSGRPITAQLDHVVVDQYGVLVIETKARTNALIRGTYADAKWTACYPGGQKKTLQNPLRQNEQHLNLLHQLLKEDGLALALDQVRGLTVFVDSDVSKLELDSVTALRVADLAQLEERFSERYDFAIGTPLTAEETAALAQSVFRLDRSTDPRFSQAHAAHRQGTTASVATPAPHPRPTADAVRSPQGSSTPPPRTYANAAIPSGVSAQGRLPEPTPRVVALGVLVVAAIGFVLWAIVGLMNGTAPWWVGAGILVGLAALGGEGSKSARRRRKNKAPYRPAASMSFGRWIAEKLVLVVLMLFMAAVVIWGVPMALKATIASMGPPATLVPVAAPAVAAPAADVALAKKRLKEADPALYKKLTSPDQPRIEASGDGFTYEWDYLDKTSSTSVNVRKISITLDAEGQIRGASQ